jgi:hypothetical protein
MSDLCERFCPAYETCIQVFDASADHRKSLVDQRKSVGDTPSMTDDEEHPIDAPDEAIDRLQADRKARIAAAEDQIDYRIGLTEADMAMAVSALVECAAAQADCPGPTISRLGRFAMHLAALWRRQPTTWPERERYLGRFAQCSSDTAQAASSDLSEAQSST